MAVPDLTELRARVPARVALTLERAAKLGYLGRAQLTEQVDHALGFAVVVEGTHAGGPVSALDLGTGGGLPGLVLGACWPACQLALLESAGRRATFLEQAVTAVPELGRVRVLRGRAEELARDPNLRERFDVVTSRSFGPPSATAECGSPFVVPGGIMVVSEPPDGRELRWPDEVLSHLGLVNGGPTRVEDRFNYQVLSKAAPTPDRYPRRTGLPAKRPLF